ncbi:MAG: hypothetical protein L6Q81_13585 [Bacteroidia bacterium]|nr:hypothetical protein [Bacteroidia bacterium]
MLKALFRRKQTYVEYAVQDGNHPALFHFFTAHRVMPDDGESYDIWTAWLFDSDTFTFTKGISQIGESFSIKSAFAARALEDLKAKTGKALSWSKIREEFDSEEEQDAYESEIERGKIRIAEISSLASDTDELPKLPDTGIVFIKGQRFSREIFTIQVRRNRVIVRETPMRGMCDYFRHVFRLENPSRVLFTYRKSGYGDLVNGMAVCIVDMSSGETIFDDFIL